MDMEEEKHGERAGRRYHFFFANEDGATTVPRPRERSGGGEKKKASERTAWGDAGVAILDLPVSCCRRSASYRQSRVRADY